MMNTTQLKTCCMQACEVIQQVGDFIRTELGQVQSAAIETKGLNSLVSYVDTTAEKQLVDGLQKILPSAGFLTEEATIKQENNPYTWIIDPLDGTTNFLHQLPFFSISVALSHQGDLVIGIVLDIMHHDCFYAWKNGGAWCNQQSIHVKKNTQLQDCLIATGFPYYDYQYTKAYLQTLELLMRNTRGIRRLGSAALDLAYVACGRFDAFFEYSLHAWDVAAGILLVQESGGVVSDFSGGDNFLYGKEIIASSSSIYSDFSSNIAKNFKTKGK